MPNTPPTKTKSKAKQQHKATDILKSPFDSIKMSLRGRCKSDNDIDSNVISHTSNTNRDETSIKELDFTDIKTISPTPSDDKIHSEIICVPHCSGSVSKGITQCSICMLKVHVACVDYEQASGRTWTCYKCRSLSTNILEIIDDLRFALKQIHNPKLDSVDVKGHLSQLDIKLKDATQELASLRITNSELVKQLESQNTTLNILNTENALLKDELQKYMKPTKPALTTSSPSTSSPTDPDPELVIGDSLVRDLHSDNQQKLKIRTLPGAKLNVVKENITKLARNGNKFSVINIVAGTNDCSANNHNIEVILEDARQTLECASNVAEKVVMSSILPRNDRDGQAHLKLENLNPRLRDMCVRMPLLCQMICPLQIMF